jgi:hypothetical protein
MSSQPAAEHYRDGNGHAVWRIVCGGVVVHDGLTSDRVVAESLAQYRRDAGRTDLLAGSVTHTEPTTFGGHDQSPFGADGGLLGPASALWRAGLRRRGRRIAAWFRVRDNAVATVQLVGGLMFAGVILAAVLLGSHH